MSARTKKFVGKGAIVAVFAVVAVVGTLIAQSFGEHPYWGGTTAGSTNHQVVGESDATLRVGVRIDVDEEPAHAAVLAYSRIGGGRAGAGRGA